MVCGARDADDGGGECVRCGNRFAVPRSIPPGAAGSRIAKMLVVRPHGEGDMVVTTDAGGQQLVVFGSSAAIELEAAALAAAGKPFPSVLEVGYAVELGRYARLTLAIDGAVPLLEVDLSFREGIDLVRRTLDAAAELEAHGFGWEPAPTDIYLRDGQVLVVRARGARRLAAGEALDAKRVLEALAGALLPVPFALATPDLIRLLLPRFNFSTVLSRSIVEARADVAVAERLAATRSGARVGAVCDPGLRRDHNDDATAVAEGAVSGEPFAVLVVCDGVSSSSHAGRAAAVAASVARDRLEPFVRAGPPTATDTPSAVRAAIEAAHEAVCASATDWGDGTPPGTTLVAAVVAGHRLTVGWVGDSRAYWVSARGAELLTSDHSWLNEVISNGTLTYAEAMDSPLAHALTKCLGPLDGAGAAEGVEPDVRARTVDGPGFLVLCTDGLWNYFPSPEAFADLVRDAGDDADAETLARYLVCRALAEGGGDNVSVAVCAIA